MDLPIILRMIAGGKNPLTGKKFPSRSVAHQADFIRRLYTLADEMEKGVDSPPSKRSKLSLEELKIKNIESGKPARSGFTWEDSEKQTLGESFDNGRTIAVLSQAHERTTLAIAIQLQSQGRLTKEEAEYYRKRTPKDNQN